MKAPLLFFLALSLGGCGALETVRDFLRPEETVRVPGERLPALTPGVDLEALQREGEVRLPNVFFNESWPQSGGNERNLMAPLAFDGLLEVLWQKGLGLPPFLAARPLVSAPVVAEGRLFTRDAFASVYALDAQTGERIWQVQMRPPTESAREGNGGGVAYAQGRLFVTTGFGDIAALDAQSGEGIWLRRFDVPFYSPPIISQGRLFVVSRSNRLFVLDAASGEDLWTHQGLEEDVQLFVPSSVAVVGQTVIVPYSSGELFALRAESGTVFWRHSLARTGAAGDIALLNDVLRPVVTEDAVVAVNYSNVLTAIDRRSGALLWTREIGSAEAPWVVGAYIFVSTREGQLVCLDKDDGGVLWVAPLPRAEEGVVWSGPVLAGNFLVLTSSDGWVGFFSPQTGELLGVLRLSSGSSVAPVVAGGTLFVVTRRGHVVALR